MRHSPSSDLEKKDTCCPHKVHAAVEHGGATTHRREVWWWPGGELACVAELSHVRAGGPLLFLGGKADFLDFLSQASAAFYVDCTTWTSIEEGRMHFRLDMSLLERSFHVSLSSAKTRLIRSNRGPTARFAHKRVVGQRLLYLLTPKLALRSDEDLIGSEHVVWRNNRRDAGL